MYQTKYNKRQKLKRHLKKKLLRAVYVIKLLISMHIRYFMLFKNTTCAGLYIHNCKQSRRVGLIATVQRLDWKAVNEKFLHFPLIAETFLFFFHTWELSLPHLTFSHRVHALLPNNEPVSHSAGGELRKNS